MKTLCRFAAIALTTVCSLTAGDLTLTFNTRAKVMGFSRNSVDTHYYSSRFHRTRSEDGKQDTLIDFEKGISYQIDHAKKVIQFMKIDEVLEAMSQMKAPGGPDMGAMLGGLFGNAEDIKVETQGTETVAGRSCTRHHLSAGRMVMDFSADPTLKPPIPAAAWAKSVRMKALAGSMVASPALKKLYEEMSRIQGIPLKTQMKGFMGADSISEATRVVEGPIPAATFELPAGYRMEDFGKKLKEQVARQH